jgi:hypothetical protein
MACLRFARIVSITGAMDSMPSFDDIAMFSDASDITLAVS